MLDELQYQLKLLEKGNFPRTEAAFAAGAKKAQSAWQEYALGKTGLPGVAAMEHPSGRYAQSIRTRQTGVFDHEIYSGAKIAERIEYGTDPLDMKTTHPYGPRSRISKKGVPYLIIPFQWGTKKGTARAGPRNIVPKELLGIMRNSQFKKSTVNNRTVQSPNARGDMVDRRTYTWGDRAGEADFAGTVEEKTLADGMVRFEQGEAGGKRYGAYFTFRVISANSPANSWIRPAEPAYHVTRGVKEEAEKDIVKMAETALVEDIKYL
jgi:hypothetical protein